MSQYRSSESFRFGLAPLLLALSATAAVVVLTGVVNVIWTRHWPGRLPADDPGSRAPFSTANEPLPRENGVWNSGLYVDLDGELRSDGLLPLTSPSLSSDCKYLAYLDPTRGKGDIALFDLGEKRSKPLVASPSYENEPLFSHKGDRLFFVRNINDGCHVCSVDVATGAIVQITHGSTVHRIIDLSSDDNFLLVQRQDIRSGDTAVYEIDLQASNAPSTKLGEWAAYTLDRSYIVYRETGSDEIWMNDLRSHKKRRVGSGSTFRAHPIKPVVLVEHVSQQSASWKLDNYISLLDLKTDKTLRIGVGHNAAFITDSLILFSQGFNNKCYVNNTVTRETHELTVPEGRLEPPRLSGTCGKVTVCIQYPNGAQVWSFGIIDASSLEYKELVRIDMADIRPSVSDK